MPFAENRIPCLQSSVLGRFAAASPKVLLCSCSKYSYIFVGVGGLRLWLVVLALILGLSGFWFGFIVFEPREKIACQKNKRVSICVPFFALLALVVAEKSR